MYAERKFTLLEAVLAMTILALIATLTGSLLFTCQRGWTGVRENTDHLDQRMRLDRIADAAFRNAVPFRWPDAENRDRLTFNGKRDSVRLAYLHRINSREEGGLRFLELFLDDSALKARFRRHPLTGERDEACTEETIVRQVRTLTFSYAVREGGVITWKPEFETDDPRAGIPAAIRMELEFENGEKVQYLRRTAGSSAVSVHGKYRENANASQ